MTPQEQEQIILDLHSKHGETPLIQLVRRLVVAIDQTELGSEHRKQTISLLNIITKQYDIPSDSSAWLDWVEANPQDLEWDQVLPSSTKPFQDEFPSEESAPQHQRRRVVVEDDEAPKAQGKARPMTKEQMIWDEALRRNEQKGWSRTKKILLIAPALSVLLGYLIFKTQVFQNLWEKGINFLPSHSSGSPENPSQPMVIMSSDPHGFWGTYHPAQNPISIEKYDHYLSEATPIFPYLNKTTIEKWTGPSNAWNRERKLWTQLFIQEHTLMSTPSENAANAAFSFRSLPEGKRQWLVTRSQTKPKSQQTFLHVEHVNIDSKKADISIKRAQGSNGIAHRIYLDQNGLLAWSWRLKFENTTLDGQIVRRSNPNRLEFIANIGKEKLHFQKPLPKTPIIPGVFSPCFQGFSKSQTLMPLSGVSSKNAVDMDSIELNSTQRGLDLLGTGGAWKESWVLQSP
jgi:hypothetical protein